MEATGINGVSITCDGTKLTMNAYKESSCKTSLLTAPAPFAAGTCSSGTKVTCGAGTTGGSSSSTNSLSGGSGNAAGSSSSANSRSGGNSQSNAFKNTFGVLGALMGLALL